MTRLILVGIIALVVVLLVRALLSPSRDKDEELQSVEMVEDPNCNTYVPKNEAIRKTVRGHEHYFCSEKCAEEFATKT